MSFIDRREEGAVRKRLNDVSQLLKDKIRIGAERTAYTPLLHILLGTIVVGSSSFLKNMYLSYILCSIFLISGIWILRRA